MAETIQFFIFFIDMDFFAVARKCLNPSFAIIAIYSSRLCEERSDEAIQKSNPEKT